MTKYILLEKPLSVLYTATTGNFDSERDTNSNKIQVNKMEVIPSTSNNAIEFIFETASASGSTYDTHILFEGVTYFDTPDNNTVTVTSTDGTEYHIEPLSYNKLNVKLRCSCLDFFYRFATWNAQQGSLLGDAPPPYTKKTDRESVNPKKVAGICKHLMKTVDYLGTENILR